MSTALVIDADTSWLEGFKRDCGHRVLLAYSRGKDAIASWLVLRKHGFDVVPYHLYLVPDLEFVQESIDWAEKFFGQRIVQLPHISLWRMLDSLLYQPPNMVAMINELDPQVPSYKQIDAEVRDITGATDAEWTATGVRAADSMVRRGSFMRHGCIRTASDGRRTVFPVWNFKKSDVFGIIKQHNARLPADYDMWRCSFDGITAQFLIPLRKHYPADYQRVLEWFPLAEIEVYRHELKISR